MSRNYIHCQCRPLIIKCPSTLLALSTATLQMVAIYDLVLEEDLIILLGFALIPRLGLGGPGNLSRKDPSISHTTISLIGDA